MAYAFLGRVYGDEAETVRAAENTTKAYQLRDRTSDAEKFFIAATYDQQVTGNLERARQTFELWEQTYPREVKAPGLLSGAIYPTFGEYERAASAAKRAIAIDPYHPFPYCNLAYANFCLNRWNEAEEALRLASSRNLEVPELLLARYDLAFMQRDQARMDRTKTVAQGRAGAEDWISDHEVCVLAYAGRVRRARSTLRNAVASAREAGKGESAALYEAGSSVWEALFGNEQPAREGAAAALKLSKSRDVQYGAAIALALAGDAGQSQSLAADLGKRFPEDTYVQHSYLPVLQGVLALQHGQPLRAIEVLAADARFDFGTVGSSFNGNFGNLYPVYFRGQAYLSAGRGAEAAAEFQKVLDRPGPVVSDPIGALAHLQIGRAFALAGDRAKTKVAYRDFLGIWKDADPDIPVLKQAQAEYARLQ